MIIVTFTITFATIAPTVHKLSLFILTREFLFHRDAEEKALNEARSEPQCIDNGERKTRVRETFKDDQIMATNGEASMGG